MKTSDLCLTSIQRARLQMDALNLLINHQMVYFPIDIFRLAKKAFKYNNKTREFVMVTKNGIITTYHYKDRFDYVNKEGKRVWVEIN